MTESARPDFRALELLDQALEEPASARAAFLDRACRDEPELRRQVEALLALETEAEEFLTSPLLAHAPEPGHLPAGTRFGAYEITGLIGHGGMGEVYRARRAEDYQAEVAIKLLGPGGLVAGGLPRFHRERQILAQLEHPNIARLIDGGTAEGRSYLVMELVLGPPIDEHCHQRHLPVDERLQLFVQVCDAVAFAHRNLVVHRDLKPGNILVTGDGVPKLLDFGIAKLLGGSATEAAPTVSGVAPMTPRYASPEQILNQPITTSTDVYALGLLLFELLTGDLPGRLRTSSPAEIARIVCEEEPSRPSTEVRRSPETRWEPETRRRLVRRLRGDLDAIVLKALRKEPAERYPSVEALVDDVRRHLEGLPVEARRGNRLYLAGNFVRRYRGWLLATAAILLAALGFGLRESWRLEFEQRRSLQLERVLEQLILTADPDTGALSPDKLLARAEEQIGELDDEPRLRGELLDSLGWMHRKLGNNERARDLAAQSLELWRRQHPGDDPDLALRLNNLGALLLEKGEYAEAEALFREALDVRHRLGEGDSEAVTTNRANLGSALLYRGSWQEAETLLRQVLEIRRRTLGPEHLKVASSLRSLGALAHARGDFEAAEPLLREALDIRSRALGGDHTAVASVLDLLARIRWLRGDLSGAEELLRRVLDIRLQKLGADHWTVAWSELSLGEMLLEAGELETARVLIVRAHGRLLAAQPEGHWRRARATSVLGGLFLAEGDRTKARPCLGQAFEELRTTRGRDSTFTREARRRLDGLETAG